MTLLISLESPFASDPIENIHYAYECCKDSIAKGESPYASHLLFPQFLDDKDPAARAAGLRLSDAWRHKADKIVFYTDKGWSAGMQHALDFVKAHGKGAEFRALSGQLDATLLASLGIKVEEAPADPFGLKDIFITLD